MQTKKSEESKESLSIQIPAHSPKAATSHLFSKSEPLPKSDPIDIPPMDRPRAVSQPKLAYSFNKQKLPPRHVDLLQLTEDTLTPKSAPPARHQANLSLFKPKPLEKTGLRLVTIQDDDMMFPMEIYVADKMSL